MLPNLPVLLFSILSLSSSLLGARQETVLQAGDTLPDGRRVGAFDNLWVGDDGTWFARGTVMSTGFFGFSNRDGGELLSNQTDVPNWGFDPQGNRCQFVELSDNNLEALFWNDTELLREFSPLELTGDPVLFSFRAFRVLENREILLFCKLGFGPNRNDAILRLGVGDLDQLESTELLLLEGDPLASPSSTFRRFAWLHFEDHSVGSARPGDFTWLAGTEQGEQLLLRGLDEVIARRGLGFTDPDDPAIDGRRILGFDSIRSDINRFGEHAYLTRLAASTAEDLATNELLVKNGNKLAQEGDAYPSLAGATVRSFSTSPIDIADSGDVFWGADLDNAPGSSDAAWMRNRDVLIREGVTTIDGVLVNRIRTLERGFHVSPGGRYWIGQVNLQSIGEGLVLADFGLAVPFPGLDENQAALTRSAGDPILGQSITLSLDGGHKLGAASAIVFSGEPAIPGSPFGVPTAFGEYLLGPISNIALGPLWQGTPLEFSLSLPTQVELVDTDWYAQGIFLTATATGGLEGRLSNAMRFEIAAP